LAQLLDVHLHAQTWGDRMAEYMAIANNKGNEPASTVVYAHLVTAALVPQTL
jgi:hypothetical protein